MSDNFLKKHADTISVMLTIITSLILSLTWINSKFNDIEKEIAVVKTVLIMKNIYPVELAKEDK
jgi:hypothetical protein